MKPPVAPKVPHVHKDPFGHERLDNYHWLRNREDPAVIKYLNQENSYLDAVMADTKTLQERLFEELKGRLKETDESVPYKLGPYQYFSSIKKGEEYQSHQRTEISTKKTEVLLDENEIAKGQEYFQLGTFDVSPNHKLLLWSSDNDGSEHYTLRVKDLTTGQMLSDEIKDGSGSVAWLKDSSGFFYTRLNEMDRPDKVYLHKLGQDPKDDLLIYEEPDAQYFVSCGLSKDEEVIWLSSSGKITSETFWVPSDNPTAPLKSVFGRREGIEYQCERLAKDQFILLTNDIEPNFRLITVNEKGEVTKEWLRGDAEIYLESFDVHKKFLVYRYRIKGLPKISWVDFNTQAIHNVGFQEKTYSLSLLSTPEFDSDTFRFSFGSPKSPRRVEEYDITTKKITTLKVQEIPSGFNSDDYETEYVFFPSHDGTQIPVSILYKIGTKLDGSHPLYLVAYGSYGMSYPAHFSPNVFSLVDRGFIFAVAHIRGGSELGRRWYDSGKFLLKKNTFEDFLAVSRGLIEKGYTSRGKLVIQGGSAGGMLMGVALNEAPELFGAIIAHVPFVDVLTTMLDDSLPLTPLEYTEWGNPQEEAYYHYIRSYSPYDNLKEGVKIPPLLITAGLNDRRVTYWEPAKWCARLRELHGENALILLKTHMGAGHGGASGRYESLKETALEYAFIFKVLGIEA